MRLGTQSNPPRSGLMGIKKKTTELLETMGDPTCIQLRTCVQNKNSLDWDCLHNSLIQPPNFLANLRKHIVA